ncbi:glutathione S-transferase family protein [Sphingomonas sp. PL-96]|uniref:glutathione S-transferase family protein n=1 Tax=Sphingomonas sp. PL-96 TaxID=2887201 RepID=UPI001E47DD7E|nr:glutathione S-transferase family protein [Sphingomonas sp. PL-96]MCC2977938.1 glutathione S-transferase family protein [Sphingomonas sp. PL-96]
MTPPVITAYDWVPDFARGLVRDLPVRWALEETGQPYTVRYLPQGSQKDPAHRALQPFGQVPTYQDGDLVLFESGAIVLHIAESGSGLLPADPAGRARAVQWMFAALNSVELPIAGFGMASLFERDMPWAKDRLPIVRARVQDRLDDLAARLGEAAWLDGDFSAGDLMMVCTLRQLRGSGLVEAYPALAAYVARGQARPAFGRALDAQRKGFTGQPPHSAAMLAMQGEDA